MKVDEEKMAKCSSVRGASSKEAAKTVLATAHNEAHVHSRELLGHIVRYSTIKDGVDLDDLESELEVFMAEHLIDTFNALQDDLAEQTPEMIAGLGNDCYGLFLGGTSEVAEDLWVRLSEDAWTPYGAEQEFKLWLRDFFRRLVGGFFCGLLLKEPSRTADYGLPTTVKPYEFED